MFISYTPNRNMSFKALVPIEQYKGTILKLTKNEKEKIAKYEHQIGALELERIHIINRSLKTRHNAPLENYYSSRLLKLESQIEILKDMIKKIKLDRLSKQKNSKLDIDA